MPEKRNNYGRFHGNTAMHPVAEPTVFPSLENSAKLAVKALKVKLHG